MGHNAVRSGELPGPVEDMNAEYRKLIIDEHLSRAHLVRRISRNAGIEPRMDNGRCFTHAALRDLHDALAGGPPETPHPSKAELVDGIGDATGIDLVTDKDGCFKKTALIDVFVHLKTGDVGDESPDLISLGRGQIGDTGATGD